METKPAVKITFTVADLKQQPGMAVQTEVKAGGRPAKEAAPAKKK